MLRSMRRQTQRAETPHPSHVCFTNRKRFPVLTRDFYTATNLVHLLAVPRKKGDPGDPALAVGLDNALAHFLPLFLLLYMRRRLQSHP